MSLTLNLTKEELHSELISFAHGVLRDELNGLRAGLREDICKEHKTLRLNLESWASEQAWPSSGSKAPKRETSKEPEKKTKISPAAQKLKLKLQFDPEVLQNEDDCEPLDWTVRHMRTNMWKEMDEDNWLGKARRLARETLQHSSSALWAASSQATSKRSGAQDTPGKSQSFKTIRTGTSLRSHHTVRSVKSVNSCHNLAAFAAILPDDCNPPKEALPKKAATSVHDFRDEDAQGSQRTEKSERTEKSLVMLTDTDAEGEPVAMSAIPLNTPTDDTLHVPPPMQEMCSLQTLQDVPVHRPTRDEPDGVKNPLRVQPTETDQSMLPSKTNEGGMQRGSVSPRRHTNKWQPSGTVQMAVHRASDEVNRASADVDLEMLRLGKRFSSRNTDHSTQIKNQRNSAEMLARSDEDAKRADSWCFKLETLVYSAHFEYFFVLLIIANAVTIGMQTDYMARHVVEKTPNSFMVVETIFCVFFVLEVMVRMCVNYRHFFSSAGGGPLNILDIVLVMLQICEISISFAAPSGSLKSLPRSNFFILRLLRIIRIVRIARTIRLLRLVGEVRAIVWSVAASLRPLCGAMVIIFLLVYVTGISLTEVALSERATDEAARDALDEHFGSLGHCMLSLYQAITGGIEWADLSGVLKANGLPFAGLFLIPLFIALFLLAIMNVITGVFVDSAIQKGRMDKESYTILNLKKLFTTLDHNQKGFISFTDFKRNIETTEMQEMFKHIDLDICEARSVFQLLDLNNSGFLDADEFMGGCLRLRGMAKAIDVLLLMREMRRIFQLLMAELWYIQQQIEPDIVVGADSENPTRHVDSESSDVENIA